MDIRNIQKTGGQSYTVTLPKEWILANSLKNKDRIKIYANKHVLTIAPFSYKKTSSVPVCHIDNMNKVQIFRELIGYYLSGTDEIIVRAKKITYEQRAAVRDLTYRLIGCECLESMGGQILIKNTASRDYKNIPDYIHKMMAIILSMFSDTATYLKSHDRSLARDVIERDVEVDRLNLGIVRSIHIRRYEIEAADSSTFSIEDAAYYEHIAVRLERMADHIVRIADYYLLMDKKTQIELGKREKEYVKQTLAHLFLCEKIIYSLEKRKAHDFLDKFMEFNQRKLEKKLPNRGIMDIVTSESISRINGYIANIAEETINYRNVKSIAG